MGNYATIKNNNVNPHLFKYREGNHRRTSTLSNPVVSSHLNLTQFSLVNCLWFQDTTPLLFSRLTGCSSSSLPLRHPSSQIYISRQAPSPQVQIHFSSCLLCITPECLMEVSTGSTRNFWSSLTNWLYQQNSPCQPMATTFF